jgi:hypothetical protein
VPSHDLGTSYLVIEREKKSNKPWPSIEIVGGRSYTSAELRMMASAMLKAAEIAEGMSSSATTEQ